MTDPSSDTPKDPLWLRPAQIAPGAESMNANVMSVLLLCFALFSAGPTWFYFDQSAFIDGPTVPAHVVDRSVSKSSGKNSSTSYRLGYIYSYDGDAYEGRSGFGLTLYLCVAAWAAARIRRRPDSES